MCKEMPVIPVNKVVVPKTILGKMECRGGERHKGSLTKKRSYKTVGLLYICNLSKHMHQMLLHLVHVKLLASCMVRQKAFNLKTKTEIWLVLPKQTSM
jgi:hypothetical protein